MEYSQSVQIGPTASKRPDTFSLNCVPFTSWLVHVWPRTIDVHGLVAKALPDEFHYNFLVRVGFHSTLHYLKPLRVVGQDAFAGGHRI